MVRLTRALQQARTRAAILDAAVEEFAEHGYADAKIDRIAERADLTRGAVYSNFAGKRSLYLAVLLDYAPWHSAAPVELPDSLPVATAAEGFARAWLEHLPLAGDTAAGGRLRSRSVAGVFDDEPGRAALAQITRLEALLLALALESCPPVAGRRVRLAELILTLLHGADHLAGAAPGFGDLFDVIRACGHLADLPLPDEWDPPHLPFVPPAERCDAPWSPPDGVSSDGLLVILGTARLGAAEEAVRAAAPDDQVTVAVVAGDPAEIGALTRLRLTDLTACLRRSFPPGVARPLHIDLDDGPALATAIAAAFTDPPAAGPTLRAGSATTLAPGSAITLPAGSAPTGSPHDPSDTPTGALAASPDLPTATPTGPATASPHPPTATPTSPATASPHPPTATPTSPPTASPSDLPTASPLEFPADSPPHLSAASSSHGFLDGLFAGDETEIAVRIRGGRIVARASGRGAGHAVAVALRSGETGQP